MKNYFSLYNDATICTVLHRDDEYMIWTNSRPYFDCMKKGDLCIIFTKGLAISDDYLQIGEEFFTFVQQHPSNEARDKAFKNQADLKEMRIMRDNL